MEKKTGPYPYEPLYAPSPEPPRPPEGEGEDGGEDEKPHVVIIGDDDENERNSHVVEIGMS